MVRFFGLVLWLGLFALGFAQLSLAADTSTTRPRTSGAQRCDPSIAQRIHKGNDYRQRDASDWMRFQYNDNKANHLDPAEDRLQKGEYTRRVMADIDFTLKVWPNHEAALRQLIDYHLAGGQAHQFEPPSCYFERARLFARDDSAPVLLEGYFYWRKGDKARAKRHFEEVIKLEPKSAAGHYNLGLLYAEAKKFDLALEHARVAYGAGYPLPGLRRRLERAGYKLDLPAQQSVVVSPSSPPATP